MNYEENKPVVLHKRYSEKESLENIAYRYRNVREAFGGYICILQANSEFIKYCGELYERGYKDWMVLGALNGFIVNIYMGDKYGGIGPKTPKPTEKDLVEAIRNVALISFPSDRFNKEIMEFHLDMFASATLKTWGFEIRGPVSMEALKKFLKERMRYFEDDLDHIPLFSVNGDGTWPDV